MQNGHFQAHEEELKRLEENALYSAQSYFEATKSIEFVGRSILFLPSLAATFSGAAVAMGESATWGVIAAVSGAISATASFLGTGERSAAYKESARNYTALRHKARLELSLLNPQISQASDVADLIRTLNAEYREIVAQDEPIPNRLFARARRRIKKGLL